MKRIAIFILLFSMIAATVYAKEFKTPIDRRGVDMSTLGNLMADGQILIIDEKPNGVLEMVTGGIIINAPPDKVYAVLTDYSKYTQYMPSTVGCEVTKEDKDSKDIKYDIEFKFSVLKFKVSYTLNQTFKKNKEIRWSLVSSEGNKLKDTYGAWQLFPLAGGGTAAFYSVYSDLKSMNIIIRKLFEAEPSMEISVNASSCVLVLKAVKNRVENPPTEKTNK